MIAPKVAVPIPPRVKPANFRLRSPAPATKLDPTVIRLTVLLKSTLFSTQMRPAVAAINPNTTIDKPPITGVGIVKINAPNFGEKPSKIANSAATTKNDGRVDLRYCHDA